METVKTEAKELKVPTFGELLDTYPIICDGSRERTGGRPCHHRENDVILAVNRCLEVLGWSKDRPYTDMTMKVLDELYVILKNIGMRPISAKSYIEAFGGIVARWTHLRYEEHGFKVESLKFPSLYVPPYRYRELMPQIKKKIIDAYKQLKDTNPEAWFFATMMLRFGMRNSDVKLLTWNSFREETDNVYLTYIPNKTRLSSARIVHWPIDDETWEHFKSYKQTHKRHPFWPDGKRSNIGVASNAEKCVRQMIRSCGVSGSKSAYELRKLCACTIYKHYGKEATSSLLGDDIETILYHYADPSSVGHKVDILNLI